MIRAMNVSNDALARPYDNSHRAAQAAQTREAILDALVRVMARGLADLSVPAVAREAGVSIRTVYRHFPTRRDLFVAVNYYLDDRMGYSLEPYPTGMDELAENITRYFRALDSMDDTIRAARANHVSVEIRDSGVPFKMQAIASALDPITGSLSSSDRERLMTVVATLFSQYTLQRMQTDYGLSADEAAQHVTWAVRTLVQATLEEGAGDS
jgi:AcrR family transcriptional regulator